METIEGKKIEGERIVLGQTRYIDCKLVNCEIIFDGTPDENIRCAYIDSSIGVAGAARHTVEFLHNTWMSGGRGIVEEIGRLAVGKAIRFED